MAEQEEWSTHASEALNISIVQAGPETPKTLSTFHPHFTYPIFGDEEQIFGYQGLSINLRFAAHNLRPNLEITYDKKFEAVGDTNATDVEETLREWMTPASFEKVASFNAQVQNDPSAKDFRPPGKKIHTYISRNRKFEIWCGELTDPAVQDIIERMQIFVSFFIEGGTPLALDDQDWTIARWRVFFIYEKLPTLTTANASTYAIVGYSTSYRFLTHPSNTLTKPPLQTFSLPPTTPISPTSLPSRARISQFLILPPHQSHSHGSHLYKTMTTTFLTDPTCTEITVEDPNEAFDDLRDYSDYTRLMQNKTLSQITLNPNIPATLTAKRTGVRVPTSSLLNLSLLESLRTQNKLAPRQFHRLVELYLLSRIPPHNRQSGTARLTQRAKASDPNDRTFYYWRLLVKQRVYKKNKDVLMQLEKGERIDKVEQTVGEVAGDYERLLRGLEARKDEGGEEVNGSEKRENGGGERKGRGKRKVIIEDDEDDEGGAEGAKEVKRRRAADGE
ncbi:histone acetyltransferase 1 [Toensbergia leucococca]|nr:histone acetyltransferase 1 [Toensbergia leucococca]